MLLVLFLGACGQPVPEASFEYRGLALGTSFSIKVSRLPPEVEAERLKNELEALLEQVNQSMSTYLPNSELSRFNQNQTTDWQSVSEDLARVVVDALAVSRWSGGAFDPTVGPLVNLWGFGPDPRPQQTPTPDQIHALLKQIGYRFLDARLSPPSIQKRKPRLSLDLSAIAKGFAVDKLAEHLEKKGIGDYLVEIGGEIRLKGKNPRGQSWRIAIEKPVAGGRQIEKVLSLTNVAMATSGDYRNFYERQGKRYSHTIDPRTGYPIAHGLASVTVLGHTTAEADALATALMVMGPEEGWSKAEKDGIAAFFIVKNKNGFQELATQPFLQRISED